MLQLHTAPSARDLVTALDRVLSDPLDDPMQPEWIAVPTAGLGRWMRIALSRSLGASDGRGDGVAGNIEVTTPGALQRIVLDAARAEATGDPDAKDPWAVEPLVWPVLDVLDTHRGDDRLGPVATLAEGATRFGQARRVANLLYRYGLQRPAMVRSWVAGDAVDGAGDPLEPGARWQFAAFRLVRDRIGTASPAELLPDLQRRLADGTFDVDLPTRIALFGLTGVPGGVPFLDLASAFAVRRDVHLFVLQPSPALAARVRDGVLQGFVSTKTLRPDPSDTEPDGRDTNPLLVSWGRANREASILWASLEQSQPDTLASTDATSSDTAERAATLLHRLQDDLRADRAPHGDFSLDSDDRSVEVHSCHGPTRQVEVLRDAILHRLASDPTLREDDVVVLCPKIAEFAPVVEAVLGPSVDTAAGAERPQGAPPLRYTIADRSLRDTYSVLGAVANLIDLIGGRFGASTFLDFAGQQPVRDRYDLDDNDLSRIADWTSRANTTWGVDGDHRARWDIPSSFTAGSWRTACDRLLLGVATTDVTDALAVGDVAPIDVDGSDAVLAGKLADLLARCAALAEFAAGEHTVDVWVARLTAAIDELFAPPADEDWQRTRVRETLTGFVDDAVRHGDVPQVPLGLADVRRMLAAAFDGDPARPGYFRGGVTVSSLTALRNVPFRVVCVLGLDDDAFGAGGVDGDDLIAARPHIGDREPRADAREALLEAVLAAGEQLVITRTGRDLKTNLPVPPATPLAELCDVVTATVDDTSRDALRRVLDIEHPRQAHDTANFVSGAIVPGRPWGFDPTAHAAAGVRRTPDHDDVPFLAGPLAAEPTDVIELSDLTSVLKDPLRTFLTRRLGMRLPKDGDRRADDIVVKLDGLQEWSVADRLLAARLDGTDTDAATPRWRTREAATGALPPGVLAATLVDSVTSDVEQLVAAVPSTVDGAERRSIPIDVALPDGTRLVGSVDDVDGDHLVTVTYSRFKPHRRLAPLLRLLALTLQDPATEWTAVVVHREESARSKKTPVRAEAVHVVGDDAAQRRSHAATALDAVVDCYRRALREPLPLFEEFSAALAETIVDADATVSPSDWTDSFFGGGDGLADATRIAFGHLSFNDVLRIPLESHDPLGAFADRAHRYADRLWGSLLRAVEIRHETADA